MYAERNPSTVCRIEYKLLDLLSFQSVSHPSQSIRTLSYARIPYICIFLTMPLQIIDFVKSWPSTQPLDVLVHNAGTYHYDRQESQEGIEATLATNHIGPFLLTLGLLPILQRTGQVSSDARMIFIASSLHKRYPGIHNSAVL